MSSASVEYGRQVMRIHGCDACHGPDLGGRIFLDVPPGLIVAPNLTAGSGGSLAVLIEQPLLAAVPAGVFLVLFALSRKFLVLTAAGAWLAYLRALIPKDRPATG